MAPEIGMDADLVRAFATHLDAQAHALSSVITAVNGVVGSLSHSWAGADANEFIGWWNNQHRSALQGAHDSVAGLAQSARNNASAQDTASGVTGSGGHAGSVAAPVAATTPSHADSAAALGPAGTQSYSAQHSVDIARAEASVHAHNVTGYDQPGECVKSVQRWIDAAGGKFGGGGVVSGYQHSGATEVALGQVRVGDVLQFTSTANPDSWSAGPVHTVLVAGVNADGSYDIVQSNATYVDGTHYAPGTVTEDPHWTPYAAAAMQWRAWRFAAKS